MAKDDLIGSAETCDILGIDRSTLSRWLNHREPKITPAMRLPGVNGVYLFHRRDVLALQRSRLRAPA